MSISEVGRRMGCSFCGVCHLSEQKCINMKIGMGAGLEIDWETVKGDLCTKVLVSVCHFQSLSL